jgi:hypothetical protein
MRVSPFLILTGNEDYLVIVQQKRGKSNMVSLPHPALPIARAAFGEGDLSLSLSKIS